MSEATVSPAGPPDKNKEKLTPAQKAENYTAASDAHLASLNSSFILGYHANNFDVQKLASLTPKQRQEVVAFWSRRLDIAHTHEQSHIERAIREFLLEYASPWSAGFQHALLEQIGKSTCLSTDLRRERDHPNLTNLIRALVTRASTRRYYITWPSSLFKNHNDPCSRQHCYHAFLYHPTHLAGHPQITNIVRHVQHNTICPFATHLIFEPVYSIIDSETNLEGVVKKFCIRQNMEPLTLFQILQPIIPLENIHPYIALLIGKTHEKRKTDRDKQLAKIADAGSSLELVVTRMSGSRANGPLNPLPRGGRSSRGALFIIEDPDEHRTRDELHALLVLYRFGYFLRKPIVPEQMHTSWTEYYIASSEHANKLAIWNFLSIIDRMPFDLYTQVVRQYCHLHAAKSEREYYTIPVRAYHRLL